MKSLYFLLTFSLCCCLTTGLQAQTIDYTFVTLGCNRVDDPDTTANKPSTANVYQLNRMFSEVSQLSPLPDYLLFTGDMVVGYVNDTVKLANQLRGWIVLYKASPLFGKSTQLVAIPGNHETQNKAAGKKSFAAAERTFVREMSEFILGSNGPLATGLVPGTDSLITNQDKLSYSFDHKGDHFVILNTDPVGRDGTVATHWVKQDVTTARANGARHIFAFGHKPAYASVIKQTDGLIVRKDLRDSFWTTLENNQGEAMFCAHNHLWEQQQPHAGKTWQIIAGNGGSNLETSTPNPYFGYTLVNVYTNGEVEVQSYGRDLNATNYSYAADDQATTLRQTTDITWTATVTEVKEGNEENNSNGLAVFPNPITNNAEIKVNLAVAGDVTLKFYDKEGKPVMTVIDQKMAQGKYSFTANIQSLANGTYIVALVSGGQHVSQKIVISK
ncbi:MAG: hypothetical protein JWO58_2907 [Chitinophagaceae bacterium]|nr:hypothetical protein [Chitinophagaceae bacterium]